jgi:acetyltransferase-like isoleucine patch superfamily enzyme
VARRKWLAHAQEPVPVRIRRAVRYAQGVASAPWHLRGATSVGARVRTLGRPRIVNEGQLYIGNDVLLRSVHIPIELATEPGALLRIGDGCSINYGVSIGSTLSVEIGRRVRIGPLVMIVDSEFHDLYQRSRRPPSRPVVIEDDVWITAKATVLPGVRIGRGSVVGASAVVTRDVAPFTVVAGIPAKPVKHLDPERFIVDSMSNPKLEKA